jgi:hypothetical protein
MAADPKPLRPGYYIDQDGDYDALDKPTPKYGPDRRETSWEDIDRCLQEGRVAELPHDLFEQLRSD